MSNFILISTERGKKISEINFGNSYTLNLKPESKNKLGISAINLYANELITKRINSKAKRKLGRLIKIINATFESAESSEGDFMICLDEITRLEKIMDFEYKKFMKKELYKMYIDELMKLRKITEEKVYVRAVENPELEIEERGHSR